MMFDLEKMQNAALAATQGEWVANTNGAVRTVSGDTTTGGRARWQGPFRQCDAEYIATANPSAILELIERLKAAEASATQWEDSYHKEQADRLDTVIGLRENLAEYKADAAKWRAHQKRKQEVIAAGMGRKILRDLETHDALPAFYAAMKEASAEPVYYEYRAWFGENTVKPGWGDWERVKPRNALCTIDDAVNELQQYISAGYKYQLRELYEHPPAMKGATE